MKNDHSESTGQQQPGDDPRYQIIPDEGWKWKKPLTEKELFDEIARLQEDNKKLKKENLDLTLLINMTLDFQKVQAEEIKRLREALSRCAECNDLATSREYAKSALNPPQL